MTVALVVPELSAGPYLLRGFLPEDVQLVQEAAADPYIPLVTSVPVPFTENDGLAFIARQHARARDGVGYSMAIADRATTRAVGSVGLWLRDLDAGRASVGYWVVASARGGRAAGHAVRAVADWARHAIGIPRLELYVEPWNSASIRTAEHAGFSREGLLRSWQEIGGSRRDMLGVLVDLRRIPFVDQVSEAVTLSIGKGFALSCPSTRIFQDVRQHWCRCAFVEPTAALQSGVPGWTWTSERSLVSRRGGRFAGFAASGFCSGVFWSGNERGHG